MISGIVTSTDGSHDSLLLTARVTGRKTEVQFLAEGRNFSLLSVQTSSNERLLPNEIRGAYDFILPNFAHII
jgi:hypothetical protein